MWRRRYEALALQASRRAAIFIGVVVYLKMRVFQQKLRIFFLKSHFLAMFVSFDNQFT